MDIRHFATACLMAIVLGACGGGEFSARTEEQDAAADTLQPEEAGEDAKPDVRDAQGDESSTDGDVDAAQDAGSDGPVEAAEEAAADGPSEEASVEAGEDAAEDVAEDQTVVEAATDVIEPEDVVHVDADQCPNGGILNTPPGGCPNVPLGGLYVCYVLPHIAACGNVGLAGGNPPNGEPLEPYYHDPMIASGGPCVAVTGVQDAVLCQLPAPSGTKVFATAGLHASNNGPTQDGRFACDGQNCRGRALVYKDGTEIGGMQNSAGYGAVTLVQHQGRVHLVFTVP